MAIYYLTYYQPTEYQYLNLNIAPPAQDKSSYIIEKFDELQRPFTVICLSETANKSGIYPKRVQKLEKNGQYIVWSGFGIRNRLFRKVHYYLRRIQLAHFLNSLKRSDVVIAYHSLTTADIYAKSVCKKRFKFILELEEIYQDVVRCSKARARWERKVIASADGFILSSETLIEQIPKHRPYIVVNGTYHVENEFERCFNDNKVHVVYAGTLDPRKGGAAAAAAAAAYLPENYHVHILGFGSEEQKNNLIKIITEVNSKTKCSLTFDGLLKGNDYRQFLQSCDIGLSTQNPNAAFNATSFPSKILSYMANGLRVVSIRIPAIENSMIGPYMYYYDNQYPEAIAKAILSVDLKDTYNGRKVIDTLDKNFSIEIKKLVDLFL